MLKNLENLDFELKFPVKPGVYRIIYFEYKGEFWPPITTKIYFEWCKMFLENLEFYKMQRIPADVLLFKYAQLI